MTGFEKFLLGYTAVMVTLIWIWVVAQGLGQR